MPTVEVSMTRICFYGGNRPQKVALAATRMEVILVASRRIERMEAWAREEGDRGPMETREIYKKIALGGKSSRDDCKIN